MNRIKKFFNIQTSKCSYCNKQKEIVNINIYSDLNTISIPNSAFTSFQICKNCLFTLGKNEIIKISLYSITRKSVFKLLDKDDLSEDGKTSLKDLQNLLKQETEYLINSLDV